MEEAMNEPGQDDSIHIEVHVPAEDDGTGKVTVETGARAKVSVGVSAGGSPHSDGSPSKGTSRWKWAGLGGIFVGVVLGTGATLLITRSSAIRNNGQAFINGMNDVIARLPDFYESLSEPHYGSISW